MINKIITWCGDVVEMRWSNTWWGRIIRIPVVIILIPIVLMFGIVYGVYFIISQLFNFLFGEWKE